MFVHEIRVNRCSRRTMLRAAAEFQLSVANDQIGNGTERVCTVRFRPLERLEGKDVARALGEHAAGERPDSAVDHCIFCNAIVRVEFNSQC